MWCRRDPQKLSHLPVGPVDTCRTGVQSQQQLVAHHKAQLCLISDGGRDSVKGGGMRG